MKFILTILIIAQIHGAFSANIPDTDGRGLMDIWDLISPIAIPIALGIDNAITTVSNAHAAVTNAVTNAIYGVTSWIGGIIPPLGKRDLEIDNRLNLLNELKSLKNDFQQKIIEIIKNLLNGSNIKIQIQQLINFLQIHLQKLNHLITILIPTMENTIATEAITSVLNAVQVIEAAIEKIHALFSS